jgi:HNH endonuclease
MNCLNCGKQLEGRQKKYCSQSCQSMAWNKEHPEAFKEHKRKWRNSDSGRVSHKESAKRWRKSESGSILSRLIVKAYQAKHPEIKKLYKARHPEKRANEKQVRRARQKSIPANFTAQDWREALAFFDNKCAYCGKPMDTPHREHFIPLSKGGGFTKDNIVPACIICNSKKGYRNPLDWLVMQAQGLVAYVRAMQYLDMKG